MSSAIAVANPSMNCNAFDAFNFCLSSDNKIAYFRQFGKTFAMEIGSKDASFGQPNARFEKITASDGSQKLSAKISGNLDVSTAIKVKVYMKVERGYDSDKFGLSLKIRGNQICLCENSHKLIGTTAWAPAHVFGAAGEHPLCSISTIYRNGEDRTLEIGRNEVVDAATGSSDSKYHGDCSQMELGLHLAGGHMKPPDQTWDRHQFYDSDDNIDWHADADRSTNPRRQRGGRDRGGGFEMYRGKGGSMKKGGGGFRESCSATRSAPSAADFRVGAGSVQNRNWRTVSFTETGFVCIPFQVMVVSPNTTVNPY